MFHTKLPVVVIGQCNEHIKFDYQTERVFLKWQKNFSINVGAKIRERERVDDWKWQLYRNAAYMSGVHEAICQCDKTDDCPISSTTCIHIYTIGKSSIAILPIQWLIVIVWLMINHWKYKFQLNNNLKLEIINIFNFIIIYLNVNI